LEQATAAQPAVAALFLVKEGEHPPREEIDGASTGCNAWPRIRYK